MFPHASVKRLEGGCEVGERRVTGSVAGKNVEAHAWGNVEDRYVNRKFLRCDKQLICS